MAASRAAAECLARRPAAAAVLKGLTRCLSGSAPPAFSRRGFWTGVQGNQQSELEDDFAPSEPAAQPVPLPLRNYTPVLSGFSVLPNAAVGVPAGLSPPSAAGNLSVDQLGKEMSGYLAQGKLEDTVRLFEDWLKFPGAQGRARVPSIMAYNLLLHAKLRLGVDPRNMLQTMKEMEMNGSKPNLLSYNFLLRGIFRQRDSKMAEKVLNTMEQSGPEVQPDADSYNFVVVLCALDRRIDAAMDRYRAMLSRGFVPSKTTYNELLLCCRRMLHGTACRHGVEILKDMKKQKMEPQMQIVVELAVAAAEVGDAESAHFALDLSAATYRVSTMDEGGIYLLLSAAARAAHVPLSDLAWHLVRHSPRDGRPPSPWCYLARIHALAAAGDLDSAFSTLSELESAVSSQNVADREVLSPFSSLRPLVLASTRGGFAALDAAYYKLAEMSGRGQPVPLSAINCVIQGCANAWDCDRAYQTFETIGTTFGLLPDVHSCNSLLDAFGRCRKIAEVLQIYNYMQQMGIAEDERTYTLLIDAHVVNRDPKAAMDAVAAMMSKGYEPSRQALVKIMRRYVKDGDQEGAKELGLLFRRLGHRDCHLELHKWQQVAAISV